MERLLPDDSPACCLGCKYPLRGLTESRCPKCGREFDPGDPKTMYFRRAPGRIESFLLRPPGLPMHLAAACPAVLILIAATSPSVFSRHPPTLDFDEGLVPAFAIVWGLRLLCTCGLAWRYGDPIFKRLSTWRRWLTLPVMVSLLWLLLTYHVPFHVAYRLSRPAMGRLAQQVMALPVGTKNIPDRWIGLYPGKSIQRLESGMRFQPAGGRGSGSFVYVANGAPECSLEGYYEHVDGPWYLCLPRCNCKVRAPARP